MLVLLRLEPSVHPLSRRCSYTLCRADRSGYMASWGHGIRTGTDCQYTILGNNPLWWRNGSVVASCMFAVREYTRVAMPHVTYRDEGTDASGTQCSSCTRPRRLFAHLHHSSTAFCKRWASRCAFCEWKVSNSEVALLGAYQLWPPLLDDSLRGHVA